MTQLVALRLDFVERFRFNYLIFYIIIVVVVDKKARGWMQAYIKENENRSNFSAFYVVILNDAVLVFILLYINLKNSMNENTYSLNRKLKKVWQGYKKIWSFISIDYGTFSDSSVWMLDISLIVKPYKNVPASMISNLIFSLIQFNSCRKFLIACIKKNEAML